MYPEKALQTSVQYVQKGRPGIYPIQATNDECTTAQWASAVADGTKVDFGYGVVWDTNGYRPATAADTKIDGVVVYGYYATMQNDGYKKPIDTNFPIKFKGAVVVVMSSLIGAAFKVKVAHDPANPGKFKVAGVNDKAAGYILRTFEAYGTAEIELFPIVSAGVESVVAGDNISVVNTDPSNPVVSASGVQSVVAGTGVAVDSTDAENPVVAATGVQTVVAGTGIDVDATDPKNPVVSTEA